MFYGLVRSQRRALGLTQAQLSSLSGVSLPTVQLIESGRANPELATVERLLSVLGLETQFIPKKADWDFLVSCGVPLTVLQQNEKKRVLKEFPTKSRFVEEMRLALLEVCSAKDSGEDNRKLKAVAATLIALQTHYPSVYAEFSGSEKVKEMIKLKGIEKLRRIALAGLMKML